VQFKTILFLQKGWWDRARALSHQGEETICAFRAGARRAKESLSPLTLHVKHCVAGEACTMESDDKKLKPKLSLELNQERQPKKKGLWQKLIEVAERLIKEEEERKDPSDW
jgi:hypothetical protein